MKSVLLSVQPKWCELIANGKKTVEVRKTKPKLPTPFKCYIYETQGYTRYCNKCRDEGCSAYAPGAACFEGKSKVIGEFVCDSIAEWSTDPQSKGYFITTDELALIQLTYGQLHEYGNGQALYGWHISDLVIYDKPKKLSVFRKPCVNEVYCESCAMYNNFYDSCGNKALRLQRPPQSWCYVEE